MKLWYRFWELIGRIGCALGFHPTELCGPDYKLSEVVHSQSWETRDRRCLRCGRTWKEEPCS